MASIVYLGFRCWCTATWLVATAPVTVPLAFSRVAYSCASACLKEATNVLTDDLFEGVAVETRYTDDNDDNDGREVQQSAEEGAATTPAESASDDGEAATSIFSKPRPPKFSASAISFDSPFDIEVLTSCSSLRSTSSSSSLPRPASPEPVEASFVLCKTSPPPSEPEVVNDEVAELRHQLAAARRHARKLQGSLAKAQQDNRVLQASSRRHLSLYKDLKAYLAKLSWATEADAAFHEEQAYIYRKEAEAARVTEQWFRHLLPPCGPDAF